MPYASGVIGVTFIERTQGKNSSPCKGVLLYVDSEFQNRRDVVQGWTDLDG